MATVSMVMGNGVTICTSLLVKSLFCFNDGFLRMSSYEINIDSIFRVFHKNRCTMDLITGKKPSI